MGIEAAAADVEAATAIPFADYLDEAVFSPMGLRHTALRGSPASDVFSTAADMTAAARHFLRPTVVHVVTFTEAVSPQFPDLAGVVPGLGRFAPNPWGLGFEVRGGKQPHWTGHQNSPATFGHFGGSGAFLWVDPEVGLGCVVLTDPRVRPVGVAVLAGLQRPGALALLATCVTDRPTARVHRPASTRWSGVGRRGSGQDVFGLEA